MTDPRLLLRLLAVLAASASFPALAQHPAPAYVRLEDEVTTRVESCPLRVELPLSPLAGSKLPYRTAKASRVQCEGVNIPLITTENHPGRAGRRARVYAQARIYMPPGFDREFLINYTLLEGEKVLATNRELMGADEGAVNWEDGVSLWYPSGHDLGERAVLRIEVLPTDAAPAARPGGTCTPDQILKMKAVGVSDEQVKAVCGG